MKLEDIIDLKSLKKMAERFSNIKRAGIIILLLLVVTLFWVSGKLYSEELDQSIHPKLELKTIVVDNYFPYAFVNEKGEPDGFSVDLIKEVAKTMDFGLTIRESKWDTAITKLKDGSVDFIPMFAYSDERDKEFDFSAPHTIAYDAFFTRKDSAKIHTIKDAKGKSIIVMKNDRAHEYLTSTGLSSSSIILAESLPDALRMLSSGKGDAALMPKLIGLIYMKELNLSNLNDSPDVIDNYTRQFGFVVKSGNQNVLERLNQGLTICKATGQYKKIYDKWFGSFEKPAISKQTILKYTAIIFIPFILILFLSFLWSWSLKKQINEKMKELLIKDYAIESAINAKAFADMEGKITYINESFLKMWNYDSKDEVLGKNVDAFWKEPEEVKMVVESIQNKKYYMGDLTGKKKSGEYFYVNISAHLVTDKKGFPICMMSSFIDITERKRSEDKFQESTERLNFVLQGSQLGFWDWNIETGDVIRNERWAEILGYKLNEVEFTVKQWIDFVHPDDRDRALKSIQDHIDGITPMHKLEYRMITKDGNYKWILDQAKAVKWDSNHKVIRMSGTHTDITELKEIEEELRKSKEVAVAASLAKSQFLSNMSHEIRTPMNAIIGFAGLLREIEDDPEKREMIDAIKYSGNTLMELINDVLSLAKIETGKVELVEEEFDVKQLVDETYKIFRNLVKNGVTLKYAVDERIKVNVIGDKLKLKQVLINLLNNSIKFTEQGSVTLKIEAMEDAKIGNEKMLFIIKDTGIGIRKENIGKIFEKFTQEDMTIDKKYGGTGLGLAIVKELVNLMKGKIEIESEVGVGTTFRLELEFKKITKSNNTEISKIEKDSFEKKIKVLLVEDNEINQKLIRVMLKNSNIDLDIESDGKEAFEKITREGYDVVLMDLQIPNMSGIEVIKEIRKKEIPIKIIVVSAYALDENKDVAIKAGADDFIAKPVMKGEVIAKINEVLGK